MTTPAPETIEREQGKLYLSDAELIRRLGVPGKAHAEDHMTRDDDTITLKDAAQHFGFSVYTLRSEADNGRLTIYKIGKRYYTTPADIKEMVRQCRVDQKARDFTSTRSARIGSSETERASSALAAANEIALRLKNSSRNTLGKSIDLPRRVRQ